MSKKLWFFDGLNVRSVQIQSYKNGETCCKNLNHNIFSSALPRVQILVSTDSPWYLLSISSPCKVRGPERMHSIIFVGFQCNGFLKVHHYHGFDRFHWTDRFLWRHQQEFNVLRISEIFITICKVTIYRNQSIENCKRATFLCKKH